MAPLVFITIFTNEQLWSLIALQFAISSEGFSKQGTGKHAMVQFAYYYNFPLIKFILLLIQLMGLVLLISSINCSLFRITYL